MSDHAGEQEGTVLKFHQMAGESNQQQSLFGSACHEVNSMLKNDSNDAPRHLKAGLRLRHSTTRVLSIPFYPKQSGRVAGIAQSNWRTHIRFFRI